MQSITNVFTISHCTFSETVIFATFIYMYLHLPVSIRNQWFVIYFVNVVRRSLQVKSANTFLNQR